MSSSPISSGLSTSQKEITREVEEEMEEEQDEEEQEEDEVEENEDDEEMDVDNNIQSESVRETDLQPSKPDAQKDISQPGPAPRQRQQPRIKKVPEKRLPGTTILPLARVTRTVKQDKDIKIVSKEAVFLISIATEFFVKKLTNSAFQRSRREKRVFVKYNDIATAVKQDPDYDWLEEVIPTSLPLGTVPQEPTIPSSSTALTNKLTTKVPTTSRDTQSEHILPDDLIAPLDTNPALPSGHDEIMDTQDESDEEP